MAWIVELKESVLDDLRWFGKRDGRLLLKEALKRLEEDPLVESRQMKTLQPNPVAAASCDFLANTACSSMSANRQGL